MAIKSFFGKSLCLENVNKNILIILINSKNSDSEQDVSHRPSKDIAFDTSIQQFVLQQAEANQDESNETKPQAQFNLEEPDQ